MTTHTPAPRNIIPQPEPYAPVEIRNGFHLICKLGFDDAPVEDFNAEQRANARLISAAPIMFEALHGIACYAENMVADIAADIDAGDTSPIAHEDLVRWSAVGAAIAKALGKKR